MFRVIHAIIANERCDPAKACVFFAMAGSFILTMHHGLNNAHPMAGFAGYNLRLPSNLVLLLGAVQDNEPISTKDAFHCWIEVDGYTLDLTAPLFDQMAPADQKGQRIAPQMFQRLSASGVLSVGQLGSPGAFMHSRNPELMTALQARFVQLRANEDLVQICAQWYVKPPKKMAPYVGVLNQQAQVQRVAPSSIRIEGAW